MQYRYWILRNVVYNIHSKVNLIFRNSLASIGFDMNFLVKSQLCDGH